MENYNLTIENGVITYIEDLDENGNIICANLYIPEEVTAFSPDAMLFLNCGAQSIEVHEDNPVFSSAHNCLLSKDGQALLKVCKNSDVSKLTHLKYIARDAFNELGSNQESFVLSIPDGVEELDYRACVVSADTVQITVPASVRFVDALAFMICSERTHITFLGDAQLEVGVFGTAAEAADSDLVPYRNMASILYPKAESITVSCPPNSKISAYCKKYGILEV